METYEFTDFDLLVGRNNCGKSTILQALLTLAQSLVGDYRSRQHGSLRMRGPFVDLGNFMAAVHRHNRKSEITLGLAVAMPREALFREYARRPLREGGAKELQFEAGWRFKAERSGRVGAGEPTVQTAGYKLVGDHGFEVRFERNEDRARDNAKVNEALAGFDPLALDVDEVAQLTLAGVLGIENLIRFHSSELDLRRSSASVQKRLPMGDEPSAPRVEVARELDELKLLGEKLIGRVDLSISDLARPYVLLDQTRLRFPAPDAFKDKGLQGIASDLDSTVRVATDALVACLRRITYLGPLRSYPERYYIAQSAATPFGK